MKRLLLFTLLILAFAGTAQATGEVIAQNLVANTHAAPGTAITQMAQSWVPTGNGTLGTLAVKVVKLGTPSGNLTFSLRGANGTGVPLYNDLCTGSRWTIASGSVSTGWVNLSLQNTTCAVSTGVTYFIVQEGIAWGGSSSDVIAWNVSTADPYASGQRFTSTDSGVTWSNTATQDFAFIVYNGTGSSTNFTITATNSVTGATINTFSANVSYQDNNYTPLRDQSGNGNTLTIGGTPVYDSTTNSFSIANSTANYLSANDSSTFDSITTQGTFYFWGAFNTSQTNSYVYRKYATTGNQRSWGLRQEFSALQFIVSDNGTSPSQPSSASNYLLFDSVPRCYAITYNSGAITFYREGSNFSSTTTTKTSIFQGTAPLYIGGGDGFTPSNVKISNVMIYNTTHNAATVQDFCNNLSMPSSNQVAWYPFWNNGTDQYNTTTGTITTNLINQEGLLANISVGAANYFGNSSTNYNTSTNTAYTLAPYTLVRVRDLYDNTSISAANVTYNATAYTTNSTGETYVPVDVASYSVNVSAANYFTKQFTGQTRYSNVNFSIYQVEVYFNATEVISGNPVTGFTITTTNATNTSSNPLYLKAGNYNITFNKTGWWNVTQQFNYTALQNTTSTFTDVYQYKLNITATNSTGAISTFNVTIIGSSYNASENTTTGAILRGWINDSVTVVFSASSNSDTNVTTNFTTYTVPSLVNISAAMLTYNTFNLTFYNETSNLLLNTTTVSLQVIGDSFAANYTITNGSATISFVTPDDYQLVYWYDEDVPRSYYVTLTDQSFTNLRLYTIDESISSVYLPVEKDAVGEACGDNTVSLIRYYIDINGYRTVEMDKSDTNGQYVLRVQPNIIPYKLIFNGACGNFTSQPQEFTGQTNTFTVTNAQSPLTSLAAIPSVAQSLTFNNATNTFIFTWTDTSNIVTAGCLQVQQWTAGVLSTPYNNCSNSSTGSLVYTITSTNQTRYVAQSTIETNTEFSDYTDFLEYSFQTAWQSFGLTGIFLTLIVVIAFVGLSLHSPDMTVIAGIGGLAIMGVFGFIAYNYTVIIGMLIIGVIMVYRIRGS